ncbi:TraM recognition domain-containing protein [Pseudonocardia sp. C8]|uniref:type IV secretory system conjugative DNA transfer family protein n=1 Tax=Pseudonocardia sp. C8 TaxID=2762759 RepID=UPI0016435631|nr:TraM recognition domain-containing protein [Pseudonocardia sp. C8]MBC3189533.1 TraM recognition domain-containing protein [Pseudonocardia sp. C8]
MNRTAMNARGGSAELMLPVTALLLLGSAVTVVEVATVLTCLLAGFPVALLGVDDAGMLVRSWLGASLPSGSTAAYLTEHSTLFLTCVVITMVLLVCAGTVVGRWWWRRWAPAPAGHATRDRIQRELSLAAARRGASRTRPGLSEPERRSAPGGELGIPFYRYRGAELFAPFSNLTGTMAPTQSGKSRMDLVHKVIDAPGALLCSTTKLDLVEFAALARSRRSLAGPVVVFDATGRLAWPAPLRWSLIEGCEDQQEANRRAFTLVEAAAVRVEAGGAGSAGNDRVFRERAVVVLTAYLVAAAVSGGGVDDIRGWATEPPSSGNGDGRAARRLPADPRPVQILQQAGRKELAANLAAEMALDPRTASAVWMSVRRVVGAWTDPRLREMCSPPRGGGLDVRRFIAQGGSLFLVADQQQAAEAVPVLTALAEHWLRTAQEVALDYPARRIDPPVTAVFDELANGTPVPALAQVVSDAAGRGLVVHWAAQSLAQLERIFGPVGYREVLDNTTSLSVWGGIKDDRTLQWISDLCSTHERRRCQRQFDGLFSPERVSIGTETAPVMRVGDIRTLAPGRVLVLHRGLPCFIAEVLDVTVRPDNSEIGRDVTIIRGRGAIPIDNRGYRTHPHGVEAPD